MNIEEDYRIREYVYRIFDKKLNVNVPKGYSLCMVMYDISDCCLRKSISGRLKRKGFKRLQMSVYMGCMPANDMNELKEEFYAAISALGEKSDSVIFVPITNDTLALMSFYGNSIDISELTDKRRVLFF